MGRYMRDHDIRPDLVLCSSATRAQQTAELLGLTVPVTIEDELYGGTAGDLMARLWEVSAASSAVLIVGHNPGAHDLAVSLIGGREGLDSFPTCALADLDVAVEAWEDLCPGTATLRALVTPRSLSPP
jgi:phosphohistidine phosphatase